MTTKAVILDMGGVLLQMGTSNGLPAGRLDYRGRQALLKRAEAGNCVSLEELETLVFEAWRHEYRERYRNGHEASWTPHLSRLRDRAGSDSEDLELLASWFAPYGESLTAIAGAVEAVRELRALGLRLALASNVPMPGALYVAVLERLGLAAGLESLQFSYDCGHRKPSPFMLRRALEMLEVDAASALMVGDRRSSDVAAGRAAGVETAWIQSDFSDGPRPDWTIESIGELPGLVASLRASGGA